MAAVYLVVTGPDVQRAVGLAATVSQCKEICTGQLVETRLRPAAEQSVRFTGTGLTKCEADSGTPAYTDSRLMSAIQE